MSKSKKVSTQASARPSWLIPVVLIGLVAVVVVVVVLTSNNNTQPFTPAVTGAPYAQLDQTVIDHGSVSFETPVESIFTVRNTGDKPLLILGEPQVELVEGCWPPRAFVSSTTIQPGQESTIKLRFTMHDGMGGKHEFRVHVFTNDPTQEEIALTVLSNWTS